jgi:hypothetical protein
VTHRRLLLSAGGVALVGGLAGALVLLGGAPSPATAGNGTSTLASSPSTTSPLEPLTPAQAASAPPVTVSPIPADGGHPIDGASALSEARGDPSVTNITQSFAKTTTWGTYLADTNAGSAPRANLTGANKVIVAAVVGTVNCDCSPGPMPTFSWKMARCPRGSMTFQMQSRKLQSSEVAATS